MTEHNPRAAYRIQLRSGFGFDQAADIISYLSDLGISHLYTSPYLQAAEGSTHGYDVVDPTRVNVELGGEEALGRMCRQLITAGLGQIIDVVPNHMAIVGKQNPWWWDVLENGPSSLYASYFDVDWEASEERWPNKVLLPVLGDHYGRILEGGQLKLTHEEGLFTLHYRSSAFPVDPSSLAELLGNAAAACGSEILAFVAESHARMPRPTATAREPVERRHRDKAVLQDLRKRLCRESAAITSAIDAEVGRFNRDANALDSLVERQNYRLALWRTASRDLGYRRFFDVNDLAGMRVEDFDVFRATHALLITWVKKDWVQGLRIDHPDGLLNPARYFHQLREACPGAWTIAEKILGPQEKLPSNWPVSGTTGYDFLNLSMGLFIDAKHKVEMTRIYGEFTGSETDYREIVSTCKRQVLGDLLGSDINRLTHLFINICERHRRHRDYTGLELREALVETAVYFPVYRTYVSASTSAVSEEDERFVSGAIENAKAKRTDLDPELFRFLKDLLLLRVGGRLEGELAMRFQQLTAPAMAKGVEDTAFYRFNRLVCLNEVGGDPDRFGISLPEFHEWCAKAQEERPFSLLASTTHDTKRSEDVRARLALLSEIPGRWAAAVARWAEGNARFRIRNAPDRNTEYLFYQTLVGAWPIDHVRISAYMKKAVRESKMETSWTKPNIPYEDGLEGFIKDVLTNDDFLADVKGFVAHLTVPGRLNSLSQTLLKLTAPGVPDIYQGSEIWNMTLVDPDNRGQVDYTQRRNLLDRLLNSSLDDIVAAMEEGLPKLWVIRQALGLRGASPQAFGPDGSYRPLYARGEKADHLIAFVRGERIVTLAPRLVMQLNGEWSQTTVELPRGTWKNILTGDDVEGGVNELRNLLTRFPVGLLVRNPG